jgi:hypothetical protein
MARNLNHIYVHNISYKQQFHQLNLHVVCQSTVQNPTLPPKHSWIKLTAAESQWLLKSVWTVKVAGPYGWQPTTLVVPNVKKIWGLNLPGTPCATWACCGMTFTYYLPIYRVFHDFRA